MVQLNQTLNRFVARLMKKSKTRERPDSAKGKSTPKNVDDYLKSVPEAARDSFNKLRAAIRSAAPPHATETISYQIPAIKHDGILVWFAAFSRHCSLFPTAAVIKEFQNDLKGLITSKGTIQFPVDKPLPIRLIKKLVKARTAQTEGKKRPR